MLRGQWSHIPLLHFWLVLSAGKTVGVFATKGTGARCLWGEGGGGTGRGRRRRSKRRRGQPQIKGALVSSQGFQHRLGCADIVLGGCLTKVCPRWIRGTGKWRSGRLRSSSSLCRKLAGELSSERIFDVAPDFRARVCTCVEYRKYCVGFGWAVVVGMKAVHITAVDTQAICPHLF